MTEWLADNLKTEHILIIGALLILARLVVGRFKTPLARSAAETLESALTAVVLVFLIIRPFVVQAFYIPSESMLPTLLEDDRILVNKFVYRFREPQHGDIIVFKSPPEASDDGKERDFIKRIIGVPGDVVEIRRTRTSALGSYGTLFLNGKSLKEDYLADYNIRYNYGPYKVPEGKLFVLGDNRNNSRDSHIWGPLDRVRVVGKAFLVFWPLDRLGAIN